MNEVNTGAIYWKSEEKFQPGKPRNKVFLKKKKKKKNCVKLFKKKIKNNILHNNF